jgi:hypothetical protein
MRLEKILLQTNDSGIRAFLRALQQGESATAKSTSEVSKKNRRHAARASVPPKSHSPFTQHLEK